MQKPPFQRFEVSKDGQLITLFLDSDYFEPLQVESTTFFRWAIDNKFTPTPACACNKRSLLIYVNGSQALPVTYKSAFDTLIYCEKEGLSSETYFKHGITDMMMMYAQDSDFEEIEADEESPRDEAYREHRAAQQI